MAQISEWREKLLNSLEVSGKGPVGSCHDDFNWSIVTSRGWVKMLNMTWPVLIG
ncbi:unnamed protein product [Brassica rapa]|uniref:Uncharacterized protein n=2 Tax=Brassica TaxID=3705 RepID=A0A3P6AES2_BRACM|nr:unnamed protein product [Brassica napus]CAG7895612.1 unnamed protein product [Brassica rapa]CDY48745.1 BnaA02g30060D [Brassica napus]VDC92236.1 unnamed protein product [Brassica rapa]